MKKLTKGNLTKDHFQQMAEALFEAMVGKDGSGYLHAVSVLTDLGFSTNLIESVFNGDE